MAFGFGSFHVKDYNKPILLNNFEQFINLSLGNFAPDASGKVTAYFPVFFNSGYNSHKKVAGTSWTFTISGRNSSSANVEYFSKKSFASDAPALKAGTCYTVQLKPSAILIDPKYSKSSYECAINEHNLTLNYKLASQCSAASIAWESSDEDIATVANGVVSYNAAGNFGDFTITATLPDGGSDQIAMTLPAGLIRELFDDGDYSWKDAGQSGNGTATSTVYDPAAKTATVTTYKSNADKNQWRGDFKCKEANTFIHAGNYPIIAIRLQDVRQKYPALTKANFNLDIDVQGSTMSYWGNFGGDNNKQKTLRLSDGSSVFYYDLQNQKSRYAKVLATGVTLSDDASRTLPTDEVLTANKTFQFKYADMELNDDPIEYTVWWVQSFKTLDDLKAYIASEGLNIL